MIHYMWISDTNSDIIPQIFLFVNPISQGEEKRGCRLSSTPPLSMFTHHDLTFDKSMVISRSYHIVPEKRVETCLLWTNLCRKKFLAITNMQQFTAQRTEFTTTVFMMVPTSMSTTAAAPWSSPIILLVPKRYPRYWITQVPERCAGTTLQGR